MEWFRPASLAAEVRCEALPPWTRQRAGTGAAGTPCIPPDDPAAVSFGGAADGRGECHQPAG